MVACFCNNLIYSILLPIIITRCDIPFMKINRNRPNANSPTQLIDTVYAQFISNALNCGLKINNCHFDKLKTTFDIVQDFIDKYFSDFEH